MIKTRMEACAKIINEENPDILLLQEMVWHLQEPLYQRITDFYDIYEATNMTIEAGEIVHVPISDKCGVGDVVCVRKGKGFKVVRQGSLMFSSKQGAQAPYLVVELSNGHKILVSSTHLDSHSSASHRDPDALTITGVHNRNEQMEEIRNFTYKMNNDHEIRPLAFSFFGGDFNWDEGDGKWGKDHGYDMDAIALLSSKASDCGNSTQNTLSTNSFNEEEEEDNGQFALRGEQSTWWDPFLELSDDFTKKEKNLHATYDSTIPMNGGGSGVRKRLDRFFFNQLTDPNLNLPSLKIVDYKIVEKSKIAVEGLTMSYWGTEKHHENVAVHPSDHFAIYCEVILSC